MSIEANKALARAAIAVWSAGEAGDADKVFAPDYVMHHHCAPDGEGDLGFDALFRFAQHFRRAFAELREAIEVQLAEGELVTTRFTLSGIHEAAYHGIPATGRRVVWSGTVIDRIEDGRIVESWGNWDLLGLLEQMGGAVRAAVPA